MALQVDISVNPEIAANIPKYERTRILLESDEKEYSNRFFCIQMPNEPDNAHKVRQKLFTPAFQNIALDLLSAPRDAIFKESVRLDFEGDEAHPLSQWSKDVTLGGDKVGILDYVHDNCAIMLRAYGQIWTVIDKPDYEAKNFEDELHNGAPYITNIAPQDVVNFGLENGRLTWFMYKRKYRSAWVSPLVAKPEERNQYCLWTPTQFIIIEGGSIKATFDHTMGVVPVVYQSFVLPPSKNTIIGITPFFTTSNMIIFANNMKSIGDMELAKHGNSVLLLHEETVSAMNTEVDTRGTPRTKMHDATGFNAFVWHGTTPPGYLTKDLQAIAIADTRANMYFSAAVDNERTMSSVLTDGATGGTVQQSGIAKAFDVNPAMASLRATSRSLEMWTTKVLNLVGSILAVDLVARPFRCEFPKRFDIAQKNFEQRLTEIKSMINTKYPSESGLRIAWKSTTPEITQDPDEQEEINKEIENADVLGTRSNMEAQVNAGVQNDLNAKNVKMRDIMKQRGMTDEEIDKMVQFKEQNPPNATEGE